VNARRILVVDDDPPVAAFIQNALVKAGYEVDIEHGGEAAITRLAQARYALALLDVGMPGMDGYETCRRIRADPATRELRVIFLTSRGGLMDRAEGEDAGSDLYLTKPVTTARLTNMVDLFLSKDLPLRRK
jgi:DNA-binding response OmpR family regulator